ncbi:hypothetical protein [Pseudomonas sp. AN-1]|uniref:hypothetical protein n=1 Tax=Pseudomonas sp. AN-1 TaxID=3096605 RepID=UPI002A6A4B97|nr:hypothetical protein [Pseudomonas sp. AN-1]WPP47052.1 hypothetical protein SK095_06555 [Pseudomonas sp. AN-1]
MIPIQEIQISTSGNALHTIHIIQPSQSTTFGAEVIVYDPQFNTSYSSLVPISGSFPTASDAFEAAFKWVNGWLQAKSQTASKINNPCNCEFLSATDQESIIRQCGIQITVEVNA